MKKITKGTLLLLLSAFTNLCFYSCVNPMPPADPTDDDPAAEPTATLSFDFENWTHGKSGKFWTAGELTVFKGKEKFYDLNSSIYTTLNNLNTLPEELLPCSLTVFKDENGFNGTAAKLTSSETFIGTTGNTLRIFLPGVVGTIAVNFVDANARFGKPLTETGNKLSGYFKYQPVGDDTGAIWLDVWKWDNVAKKRDTIGSIRKFIDQPVTSWTKFDEKINYRPGKESIKPDSINILFVASSRFNFEQLFNCVGNVGSTLWIDEIQFTQANE